MSHHVELSGFTRSFNDNLSSSVFANIILDVFQLQAPEKIIFFYIIKLIFHATTVNFANPAQKGKPRKNFETLDCDNLFTRNGRAIHNRTTRKSVWIHVPELINPLATGFPSNSPMERPILVDIQSPTAPIINMRYAIGSILALNSNKWIDNKYQYYII